MKQIVTLNLNHICPMVTGVTPHVGGPIVGPGCPGVLVDSVPVSVMGDTCVCCGPPDMIVQGYPGVMVDGTPVVVQNCMTAHGGIIPMGVTGVVIGTAKPIKPITMNIRKIPFPKIRTIDNLVAAISGNLKNLRKAASNQDALRIQSSQEEPAIYNVHWEKEEIRTDEGYIKHKITVAADTIGFDEGETVTFTISPEYINPEFGKKTQDVELQGIVKDSHVTAEWIVKI